MSAEHTYPLSMLAGETHKSRSTLQARKGRLSLRNCFAARVADDSMKPVAGKGQYVLASPDLPPRDGDLVLVKLGGEPGNSRRLRLYHLVEGRHTFQTLNTRMDAHIVVRKRLPPETTVVVGVAFMDVERAGRRRKGPGPIRSSAVPARATDR